MNAKSAVAAWLLSLVLAGTTHAQVPDVALSFYVPQVGPVASPTEGNNAIRMFRGCPNNDGGSSFPNNARIKVRLRNSSGNPIPNITPSDIYIKFNGGTPEQGFSGDGADSVIANGTYNVHPQCPLLQYVYADAPTDVNGDTYITLAGASPEEPGVTLRDKTHKWGHYDSELPVFALGVRLQGRLTSASFNESYILRIKTVDFRGGVGTALDQGEVVSLEEQNSMVTNLQLGVSDELSYWRDLDSSGTVTVVDLNILEQHLWHDCDDPYDP